MLAHTELARDLKDEVKREERLARILAIEDRVYDRAASVAEAFLSFHEVSPNQEQAPPDWIERYGAEGARQRLEVAKAGWLPQSIAPSAAKYAIQAMVGIARGRGQRVQLKASHINVKISLPAPTSAQHPIDTPGFEVRDIE